jgi:hypothetical protein
MGGRKAAQSGTKRRNPWPINRQHSKSHQTARLMEVPILLSLAGIAAYFVNNDHFISGSNLAINIVTLLILPILQATQNRDGAALQAKLDELIKDNSDACNETIGLGKRGEDKVEQLRADPSEIQL